MLVKNGSGINLHPLVASHFKSGAKTISLLEIDWYYVFFSYSLSQTSTMVVNTIFIN